MSLKKVQVGKMKQTKMMRAEECWKNKGQFDHFGFVLGSLGLGVPSRL
jgi:hypothetical protein